MFRELSSPSLKQLFVNEMEELILSGQLKPGDKLPPEREIAENMKISRTVVSSGIAELVEKGFLDVRSRQGTYVQNYLQDGKIGVLDSILARAESLSDPHIIDSIFEAREVHERAIVQLSAQRHTKGNISKLREIITELSQSKDAAQYGESIFSFYHTIALASGNVVLSLSLQSYRNIYVYIAKSLYEFTKAQNSELLGFMSQLVEFIEQGQTDSAVECAIRLVRLNKAAWNRFICTKSENA